VPIANDPPAARNTKPRNYRPNNKANSSKSVLFLLTRAIGCTRVEITMVLLAPCAFHGALFEKVNTSCPNVATIAAAILSLNLRIY
jgi:hypothetical protein